MSCLRTVARNQKLRFKYQRRKVREHDFHQLLETFHFVYTKLSLNLVFKIETGGDAKSGKSENGEEQQQGKTTLTAAPAKKRHRGCSFCILDIENSPIPDFPPNEEVVGVITMEDVIEELLQVNSNPSLFLSH